MGIKAPWYIKEVIVDGTTQRVDIYLDHERDIRVRCPVCGVFYAMYDHAPERVYRHLNTCQMETHIHVRAPRVNCPVHGVKQIDSEVGENGSDMTFAFESHVIRMAQECGLTGVMRLCGLKKRQRILLFLCQNTVPEFALLRGSREDRGPREVGRIRTLAMD
ncbi:MAG: transposase family protein [Desulfobacterales bacterium]|nr:transposase family protein [Desulfobacterales bacterium]